MQAAAAVESELVRLLMRIGYLAAWRGLFKEAMAIFDGVRAVRPRSELPIIGAAVVAMLNGRGELAVRLLQEEALPLDPTSDIVRAHLGAAMRMNGSEEEGRQILEEISQGSANADARQMAQNLLSSPTQNSKPIL